MTPEQLITKYYAGHEHPYARLRREVQSRMRSDSTVVDLGCGREAPELQRLAPRRGIGVDPVVKTALPNLLTIRGLSEALPLASASADLIYCRSVLEHLSNPAQVFQEVSRVLKPQGSFLALTPSQWEYAALISRMVPNRFHARIVAATEGREEGDTFPTFYRANSEGKIRAFADSCGLTLESIAWLNQYPAYLVRHSLLFRAGVAYERVTSRFHALRHLRGSLLIVLRKPH